MSKKAQWLLVAFGLLLLGSTAHALPVSKCVDNGNGSQTCNLYESDASGKPSETSSARTQNNPTTSPGGTLAPFGADWAPRWVVVYKDAAMKRASDVVHVTKSSPPVLDGQFAEEAFLYSDGYANFATILAIALSTPPCNPDNNNNSECLLKIVEDAKGIATFTQPWVDNSLDSNSPVACTTTTPEPCDTIIVHSRVHGSEKKDSDRDKKDKDHHDQDDDHTGHGADHKH